MSNLRENAAAFGFKSGWTVIQRMPASAAYSLFEKIADRSWRGQGDSVAMLQKNLSRVLPDASAAEIAQISKEGMRTYMRYYCDAFRLPGMDSAEINRRFRLQGKEILDSAMASGSGAIMVLPHMGNWDLAGAWACQRYGGLSTVVEQLKPEALFEEFLAFRRTLGMEALSHKDPATIRTLTRRLKAGGLVCIVGDRDLGHSGVPVEFFGHTATFAPGPALLSELTGAPLHPVALWYEGAVVHGIVLPAVTSDKTDRRERITDLTTQVATAFEVCIREHPENWHMLQPLWSDDVVKKHEVHQ